MDDQVLGAETFAGGGFDAAKSPAIKLEENGADLQLIPEDQGLGIKAFPI